MLGEYKRISRFLIITLSLALISSVAWGDFWSKTRDDAIGAVQDTVEIIVDTAEETIEVIEEAASDVGDTAGDIATGLYHGAEDTVKQTFDIAEDLGKGVISVTGLNLLHDIIIQGDSLERAFSESWDDVESAVQSGADAFTIPNHMLDAVAEIFDDKVGVDIAIVFFPIQYASELPGTATEYAFIVMRNPNNVDQFIGIPLAAAFSQVANYFEGQGRPIPEPYRGALSSIFSKEELDAVRYVVDKGFSNLASLTNEIQHDSSNHAVTVGNLIIFAEEPDSLMHWAHEIQHTIQYRRLGGLQGFATEYTKHYRALEAEAVEVSRRAIGLTVSMAQSQ